MNESYADSDSEVENRGFTFERVVSYKEKRKTVKQNSSLVSQKTLYKVKCLSETRRSYVLKLKKDVRSSPKRRDSSQKTTILDTLEDQDLSNVKTRSLPPPEETKTKIAIKNEEQTESQVEEVSEKPKVEVRSKKKENKVEPKVKPKKTVEKSSLASKWKNKVNEDQKAKAVSLLNLPESGVRQKVRDDKTAKKFINAFENKKKQSG